MKRTVPIVLMALMLAACSAGTAARKDTALPFSATEKARFNEPWALAFLPDGTLLVTEKAGTMKRWNPDDGSTAIVAGVPAVAYGGQGGLGDVVAHPHFTTNRLVYISHALAAEGGTSGAVVIRAKLSDGPTPALTEVAEIWRQFPFVEGRGHFGHRIAFAPDGKLFISSGDRQKFDPAQDVSSNLGKIVRLNDDGSVPADNPFAAQGGVAAQIWSLGHRNPLGLAFDGIGQLWNEEMGPRHGDELNLVKRGANYGYPKASNGTHYDGRDIPDHKAGDGFEPPKLWWDPAISPGGIMVYSGTLFPAWKGDMFIAALGGTALIRVNLDGEKARKADHWPMNARIRDVEQGPDGALWVIEDGADAKLLKLVPAEK